MASVKIDFIHPETERVKKVKLGPSWTMLFLSPFFGIPLFFRKMFGMGIAMLILTLAALLSFLFLMIIAVEIAAGPELLSLGEEDLEILFTCFLLAATFLLILQSYFSIFLAVRANRITAKHLYKNGWKILPIDDPAVLKNLRMAWEMPTDAFCDKDDIISLTDDTHRDNISGRRLKYERGVSPKHTVFE